jgi:hypothetical protein
MILQGLNFDLFKQEESANETSEDLGRLISLLGVFSQTLMLLVNRACCSGL